MSPIRRALTRSMKSMWEMFCKLSMSFTKIFISSVRLHPTSNLDVGCNVDLYYVANHESADLIYEEQTGDASFTLNES